MSGQAVDHDNWAQLGQAMQAAATAAMPKGCIVMWSGAINAIPGGWKLCDGNYGTPDLRDRFVVGAGNGYAVGASGGSADAIVVTHKHDLRVNDPGHTHHYGFSMQDEQGVGYPAGGSFHNNNNGYFESDTEGSKTGISVDVVESGSSGANANLPPYYALAYIMKV